MVGMRMKFSFFDDKAVMRRVDKATRKVLSRFGAFVRRTAKSSIRKRKRASEPGKPPSSHAGTLKRLIYFGFDPARESVVIGPAAFHSRTVGEKAPPLLEYGGSTRRKGRGNRTVIARYRPRPFMGPAFEKEKPKLPAMWAGSVKP